MNPKPSQNLAKLAERLIAREQQHRQELEQRRQILNFLANLLISVLIFAERRELLAVIHDLIDLLLKNGR